MSRTPPPFTSPEAPRQSAGDARPASHPYPRMDGIDVLLVEDDVSVLDAFRFVFETSGATVRTAESARAAWEAFRQRVPDLVVSDIGMPGEDGCALLRRIRAEPAGRAVPAIALTGYARSEDGARAREAGFAVLVPKPVDPVDLVRLVLELLGRPRA